MDKTKILVVLLAISLCGNIFLLAAGGNNPSAEGISQFLLYAYHQAFPPLENETIPQAGNESNWTGGNITEFGQPNGTKEFTVQDILSMLDKNEVPDEALLQILLSLENESPPPKNRRRNPRRRRHQTRTPGRCMRVQNGNSPFRIPRPGLSKRGHRQTLPSPLPHQLRQHAVLKRSSVTSMWHHSPSRSIQIPDTGTGGILQQENLDSPEATWDYSDQQERSNIHIR